MVATGIINALTEILFLIDGERRDKTTDDIEKKTTTTKKLYHLHNPELQHKLIATLPTERIYWCLKEIWKIRWKPIDENNQLLLGCLRRTTHFQRVRKRKQRDSREMYSFSRGEVASLFFLLEILSCQFSRGILKYYF